MNIKYRLPISALAVVINGIAALALLSPTLAHADACSAADGTYCDVDLTCYEQHTPGSCQAFAPPGCKLAAGACISNPCGGLRWSVLCSFTAS